MLNTPEQIIYMAAIFLIGLVYGVLAHTKFVIELLKRRKPPAYLLKYMDLKDEEE